MPNTIKEWLEMNEDELATKISRLRDDYHLARENVRIGKEKNHASLKYLKRDIARAITILKSKANK